MSFPIVRMRRLRRNEALRDMVAETTLTVNDLIYPMFVCHGKRDQRRRGINARRGPIFHRPAGGGMQAHPAASASRP